MLGTPRSFQTHSTRMIIFGFRAFCAPTFKGRPSQGNAPGASCQQTGHITLSNPSSLRTHSTKIIMFAFKGIPSLRTHSSGRHATKISMIDVQQHIIFGKRSRLRRIDLFAERYKPAEYGCSLQGLRRIHEVARHLQIPSVADVCGCLRFSRLWQSCAASNWLLADFWLKNTNRQKQATLLLFQRP